jgi:hypothetical protein
MRDTTVEFRNNGITYRLLRRTISRREHEDLGKHIKPEPMSERERRKIGSLKERYTEEG